MATYYALAVDALPGLIIEATDDNGEAERVALAYSSQTGQRTVVTQASVEFVPSLVFGEPPSRNPLETAVPAARKRASAA
jgi:hypothetical protein